jgi:hypothetical protein
VADGDIGRQGRHPALELSAEGEHDLGTQRLDDLKERAFSSKPHVVRRPLAGPLANDLLNVVVEGHVLPGLSPVFGGQPDRRIHLQQDLDGLREERSTPEGHGVGANDEWRDVRVVGPRVTIVRLAKDQDALFMPSPNDPTWSIKRSPTATRSASSCASSTPTTAARAFATKTAAPGAYASR